jgi:hypothetical protein
MQPAPALWGEGQEGLFVKGIVLNPMWCGTTGDSTMGAAYVIAPGAFRIDDPASG